MEKDHKGLENLDKREIEQFIENKIEAETKSLKRERENEELRKNFKSLKEKISERQELEKNEKMSRRSFLKKFGAGAVGIGALGLSPVSSQLKITQNGVFSNENMLVGGNSKTEFSQEVDLQSNNILNIGRANSAEVNDSPTIHFCSQKTGSDPDARLDKALSDASDGDIIMLELAMYTDERTTNNSNSITKSLEFRGQRHYPGRTTLNNDWENTESCMFYGIRIDDDDQLTVSGPSSHLINIDCYGTITIATDGVLATMIGNGGEFIFESGTSNGEIGVTQGQLTVTDNGSNSQLT